MSETKSTIDFSTYSDSELESSLARLDRAKFPENLAALLREIELRKASPRTGLSGPTEEKSGFLFLGTGDEYFKIWIVNVFLCLLTLGLYTPWAKVRSKRYFYSRTRLAGNCFHYTADPLRILWGRIILVLIVAFAFVNSVLQVVPHGALINLGLWVFFLPFIIWKSAKFNFSNTVYRGIPFSLKVSLREVYVWSATQLLLGIVTLGIYWMSINYQARAFFMNHLYYGQLAVRHERQTQKILKELFPMGLVWGGLVFIVFALLGFFHIKVVGLGTLQIVTWGTLILYLGGSDAVTTNFVCGYTTMEGVRLRSDIKRFELAKLYIEAAVLSLITLGLAWPWVRIKILKYKCSSIQVFMAPERMDSVARDLGLSDRKSGGFATDIFDFDLGF